MGVQSGTRAKGWASRRPQDLESARPASGPYVIIAAAVNGKRQLWLRPLDALQAQPMPRTDAATYPFWSPDSRCIAFFAQGKLKKLAASGGPAQSLCNANDGRGGSWGAVSSDHDDPENNQRSARDSCDDSASGSDLFEQNEASQRGDPEKVHHAHREEDAHQRPTAAEAIRPVAQAHAERAQLAVAPVRHQKPQRTSAMRQAFAFPGSQLIGTRGDENRSGQIGARCRRGR